MSEPDLISRQRVFIQEVEAEIRHRVQTEPVIERAYLDTKTTAEEEYQAIEKQANSQFLVRKDAFDVELAQTREQAETQFKVEQEDAAKKRKGHRAQIRFNYKSAREQIRGADQDARWSIAAVLEGAKNQTTQHLHSEEAKVRERMQMLETLQTEVHFCLQRWKMPLAELNSIPLEPGDLHKFKDLFLPARELANEMHELTVPRWVSFKRLIPLFLLIAIALAWPIGLLTTHLGGFDQSLMMVLATGGPVGLVIGMLACWLTYVVLRSMARRQVEALYLPFRQHLSDAEIWRDTFLEQMRFKANQEILEAKKEHNRKVLAVREPYDAQKVALRTEKKKKMLRIERRFRKRLLDSRGQFDSVVAQAVEKHRLAVEKLTQERDSHLRRAQAQREKTLTGNENLYQSRRQELLERWNKVFLPAQAAVAEIRRQCGQWFPDWNDPVWNRRQTPQPSPPVFRFGQYSVNLDRLWDEASDGECPRPEMFGEWVLPALTGFPDRSSLLFLTEDEGRNKALEAVRCAMMRMLSLVPPGKLRFTIIDPVGLGQNFAAFMNLADHDEALVTSRIWTEQSHIEQRLADLTAHMETVIQTYLRNRYENITEYNAQADELAEPYRVLVVANFPVNFTLEATRRLVSICQSGARCGVSVLITVDRKQELPQGFELNDLTVAGASLVCAEDAVHWNDELGRFPLKLDPAPDDAFCAQVLQRIGEQAKAASQVQVPFDFILPTPERWWTHDSRDGLVVPLGRSGATKRQLFALGQGTSQHVLVAGKTGSGKSTLLHALIVNLAAHYSPDEIELYLVDFKKGVEFKTYAVHELAHARVVAIESEREFGLSVLQRLDAELRQRGEMFREHGAQNLRAYRDATGNTCPRILLIVDEFQEFFVEDDRISQDAAQLLDRLVRQGRAFGLHVMLGSQTLGGAYSLARSTIDQMAVRIALQCSEADAALILSDENSAARLLSRPGEAIYNDANGRLEGNNPFQVVWLSDERRESLLQEVERRAVALNGKRVPPLVFEGHALADVSRNHLLGESLRDRNATMPRSPKAWLGEAIAIKDPTSAIFARQSGTNLLVVGAQDQAALGMLGTALISLATQCGQTAANLTNAARFYVLDGSTVDSPLAGQLAKVANVVPHAHRCGMWREVPKFLDELSKELTERQQNAEREAPPLFLFVFGLQRLRDLRRSDDDYGFGKRDEPLSPAQQFGALLTEGPALGIHVLLWCDTLANVQRALDRQGLRECTMRVAFQMNVNDSSALLDTPLASKLGAKRAMYADEEGRVEKFRPYDMPPEEWLTWAGESLRQSEWAVKVTT